MGSFWTPSAEVLSLSALREIVGVKLNEACSHCSLIKKNSSTEFNLSELKKGVFIKGDRGNCRGMKFKVDNLTSVFASYGFIPSCLSKSDNKKCYVSQIAELPFHRCWETDNKIFNILFAFGIIGLFLNASVFLVTMTEAKLRKKVLMLLISSLAVGDFLVQIYSISLASVRKRTYNEFLLISEKFCNFAGFIWTIGMFVTITTSVLLTVERYLTIVYSLKPEIHIHCKGALSLISVSWLVALTISILPYMGIGTYTGNTLCVPVVPSRINPTSARFSIGLLMIGIVLYLSMIPFYVLIFVFVKKSGSGLIGIKREGSVAFRIFILVGSNMMFFFLPVIITTLYITTDITKGMTPVTKEALTGALGTICTSVNSFLNPLLYAYRNHRFRRVLCHRLAITRKDAKRFSPSPSHDNEVQKQRKNATADLSPSSDVRESSDTGGLNVNMLPNTCTGTKQVQKKMEQLTKTSI